MDIDKIKKEIITSVNRGYFSGMNNECSKEIDKLANDEADRIILLILK